MARTKRATRRAASGRPGRAAKPAAARRAKAAARRRQSARTPRRLAQAPDPLLGAIAGSERRTIGGVTIDVARAGTARVKRTIYPAGFRWSAHMKPVVGTDRCEHAHVGFLARGRIRVEYADGCAAEYAAPQFVAIEPGHDGWVVGTEPAVLIEIDFERDTVRRLGMPEAHRHA